MKRLIIFLLLFAAIKVAGQTTGYLRFDTVKITKQNGTSELYIINATKDSLGLLTNVGGGLTRFMRPRVINDSTLVVGLDTLVIKGGAGGGGGSGSADSTIFATLFRVDTAKSNLRTEIADKVDGTGTAGRVTLWSGAKTVTSDAQLTYNSTTNDLTTDSIHVKAIDADSNLYLPARNAIDSAIAAVRNGDLWFDNTSQSIMYKNTTGWQFLQDLGNSPIPNRPNIRFGATVIRGVYNAGTLATDWGFIIDPLHDSLFFDSISVQSNHIRLHYPTSSKVITFLAVPDESLARFVDMGASVGISFANLSLYRRMVADAGYIRGSGSTTLTKSTRISGWTVAYTPTTGVVILTPNNTSSGALLDGDPIHFVYSGNKNIKVKRLFSGITSEQCAFVLTDDADNVWTDTLDTNDNIFIQTMVPRGDVISPGSGSAYNQAMFTATSNIWLFAVFELDLKIAGLLLLPMMLIGRYRRSWFNQQPMPKSKKKFKFSFLFVMLLIFSASAIGQSGVTRNYFGNTWKNIGNGTVVPKRWGWINNGDSIAMVQDFGLDMRKPILFARWNTAGRPGSPIAGYIGYNTDSTAPEYHNGSTWVKVGGSSGGGGGGITAIGTINSQTKAANGAVIAGTDLVMQTADASNPGIVSTGAQSFAGVKTFTGIPIFPTGGASYFDTDASHTLTLVNGINLAFNRTLTFLGSDANKSITLNGNISFAAAFRHLGAFSLDLTATGATNVTLPTTGTLATLAGTETFTNKTIAGSTNILGSVTMDVTGTDADGDTYHRASNVLTRLGIGAANTINTSSGTAPQWSTAAAVRAMLAIDDGSFTPTVVGSANASSITVGTARYTRNGSRVYVSGTVSFTATATTGTIVLTIPIASAFTVSGDGNGGGGSLTGATTVGLYTVSADAVNDAVSISFGNVTAEAYTFWYFFIYDIM